MPLPLLLFDDGDVLETDGFDEDELNEFEFGFVFGNELSVVTGVDGEAKFEFEAEFSLLEKASYPSLYEASMTAHKVRGIFNESQN